MNKNLEIHKECFVLKAEEKEDYLKFEIQKGKFKGQNLEASLVLGYSVFIVLIKRKNLNFSLEDIFKTEAEAKEYLIKILSEKQ